MVRDGGDWVLEGKNGETRRFDEAGRLIARKMGDGTAEEAFVYSGEQLTSYTDSYGNETTFSYSNQGKLSGIANSAGHSVTVDIDDDGNLTSVTDGDGVTSSFVYDDDHRMLSRTSGGSDVSYTWDDRGTVSAATLSTGEERTYRSVFQATAPDGIAPADTATALFVDGEGGRTEVGIGNNGEREWIETDGQHWEVSVSTEVSMSSDGTALERKTATYTSNSEQLAVRTGTDESWANLNGFQFYWEEMDEEGRPTYIDNRGAQCDFTYSEESGLLYDVACDSAFYMRYDHDAEGRATALYDYNDNEWNLTYDDNGNLSSIADPLGGVTRIARNPAGYLTGIEDPAGRTSAFTRDQLGNTTAVTDAHGETAAFTYTRAPTCPECGEHGADVMSSVTDPLGNTWSYWVRADGLYSSVTDPLGNRTKIFEYDGRRQLISASADESEGYEMVFDTWGEIESMVIGDEDMAFTYDDFGRLTSATSDEILLARAYDDTGEWTTETVTDQVAGRTLQVSWQSSPSNRNLLAFRTD